LANHNGRLFASVANPIRHLVRYLIEAAVEGRGNEMRIDLEYVRRTHINQYRALRCTDKTDQLFD
jgi:hypothetical protein